MNFDILDFGGGKKFDVLTSNLFSSNHAKLIHPASLYYFEVTLNHPRSARFKRLIYESRCKLYHDWLESLSLKFPWVKTVEYYYEKCADGQPHAHAIVKAQFDSVFSAEGAVMELVKDWAGGLPKRSWESLQRHQYEPNIDRFKCPCICINFKRIYAPEWENYIKKNI